MGEFELSYFEVNKGKNKAKYLSHQMHNYSKSYKSIERKLKGQKGLGLESVREQLVTLSNKCDYVSNDLEQIGLFLEQVISLTEQADNDARKLLESFSMRKVDRVIKYTKEVIKDALKTVFAALGVQFDNNPQAKWFIDFAGWGIVMRIGLVDVDGHNFPNIALMKLSAWHKRRGDTVEFADPAARRYDKVYMSKVFTFSRDCTDRYDCEVVRAGTGYRDYATILPEEIEHICPDYSLYWGQGSLWVSDARMREPLFVVRRAP